MKRRAFLELGLLAGGGFALGFVLPGCGGKSAESASGPKPFAPNAWVRVYPNDRVVFVLDRVEMGQGTLTGLATLVAEELEIEPRRLHVEFARAGREFDNQDEGLGFQVTGGSTSVRAAWEPLRRAGATAREMLRRAAAKKLGVPLADCRAENGAIVTTSGKHATYGELAVLAQEEPLPEVELKSPASFRYIGKELRRLDAPGKSNGSVTYGIDLVIDGLLTAVVVRPPTVDGKVDDFDATAVMREPGVVDVVRIPTGVAVVATSYHRARAASEKLRVTWKPGRVGNVSSAELFAAYRRRLGRKGKVVKKNGDVDDAFEKASPIQSVYELPYLAHAPLEPPNATAHVTDSRCEIWAPTQSPALARAEARRITGLDPSNIIVHQTWIGGGFGRRLAQDYVKEAVHVSRLLKRPVKVLWSREDDLGHSMYRPMAVHLCRGSVDEKGRISAWFQRVATQSIVAQVAPTWVGAIAPDSTAEVLKHWFGRSAGAAFADGLTPDTTSTEGSHDLAYDIPSLRIEHALIDSKVPIGFWRSVGYSHNTFVVESFFDELAHAAKRDPYELRREMLAHDARALRVLDLVAEKSGWKKPPPPGVFRGIARAQSFHTECAQVVELSVDAEHKIKLHRVVVAVDCGTVVNPDLVRAQLESGVIFGLSAALKQRITLAGGAVEQTNYHEYPLLRMHETPKIEVYMVPSSEAPTGVGEPGVPPIGPATANAIFAATGIRVRSLPIEVALGGGR